MTPLTYKLIAHDGRILGEFTSRYDADKALFAARERAAVHQFHWNEDASEIVNDNHDVFPLEPEEKSAWIPVGERLPEPEPNRKWSAKQMVTDGSDVWSADLWIWEDEREWYCKNNRLTGITHWCPLPALP